MRTVEKFKRVYNDMEWFLKMHKRPVWIVPSDNDYHIDVIKPNGDSLPYGTSAIEYGNGNGEIEPTGNKVVSSKTL